MQSILAQLYNGNILPYEEIQPTEEIRKASSIVNKLEEEFKKTLTEQQLKEFEQFTHEDMYVTILTTTQTFTEGFKLATKIMIEIFESDSHHRTIFQKKEENSI